MFINSVTDTYINNTLSAFNLRHLLPTDLLRLNDFFATLKNILVDMYNMNEKNSKVQITGRTFLESLSGKL